MLLHREESTCFVIVQDEKGEVMEAGQAVCGRTKTRPAKPCIFRPTAFGLPAEPAARPPPPALTAGTLDDVTMSRFASSVLQRYIGSVSLPAILFLYMLHAN